MPTPNSHLTTRAAAERKQRRWLFGQRIRELRTERGMTQEKLALAASLDRPFLVQLESGQRSVLVERLDDIASALGVNVADLFPAAAVIAQRLHDPAS